MIFSQIKLFGQDFQWVRVHEGSYFSGENASAIEVDDNENTYTFGIIFEQLFDIDPTSGTQIIDNTPQSTSQQCSLFLTKLDTNGNFIWGKTFGSIFGTLDRVIDMEIGTDNNIYLLADIYEQTTFIQKFITIFKIDPQGNILLTKKITNLNYPNQYDVFSSSSLSLDSQNNIFITGSYKYHLQIDTTNPQLNFNVGGDSFLLKMDSSGNILWGRKFDVLFTNGHYESVKIDNNQNPIVVVSNGDNQSYTNYGYNVFKINSNNGSNLWQKYFDNQDPNTFNIDHNGNIIIAGNGKNHNGNDIDVDPSSNTFLISPKRYLLWLTNNGDFLDAKEYLPTGFNYFVFSKIEFDIYNNTYLIGEFNFTFDADPSSNTYPLSYICGLSSNIRDAFFIKFDNTRNFDSAFKLGDFNNNCINFYFTDFKIKNNNQYYVGNFASTADFDPSTNSFPVNTNNIFGSRFTLKLGPCNTAIPVGSSNQTFCASQNPTVANLQPNSSSTKWYSTATSTNQLSNTTPLINGQTYYVSRQIGSCPESQRLAVTVNIIQSPLAPIALNQTFCENTNATISNLIATGQNIKWYASLNDTNSLPTNTTLQNNTNYYATQTINGCESSKTLISVTINSVPLPSLTSPQTFCIQQNAVINSIVISGQNIKWYDASTGGNLISNTSSLINGQTYYASQTINNCESLRVPVLINIQNTPPPTGTTTQTFCSTLNATINDLVVNGSNLIWYNSNSSTTVIPSTTPLVNGSTYYASQVINNCESVNRLAITVNLINALNASDYSETICDNLNDGSEIINLPIYNTNLISNTTNCTFEYYSSLAGATNQINADLISTISNYNLTIGNHTFFVRIISTNGCHSIVKLNLALVNNPFIAINNIVPICENRNIIIDAGSGFDSYIWSTGSTSQSITIINPGNYSVTVTKNYGTTTCSTTKNFTVVLSNAATITNIETQDWTDNENIITVNTTGFGNYEFSIDGINYQDSNVFYGLESGAYTVYVRDKNGCGITEDDIFLLMYPKFFTPNGDGYNDTWTIKFSNIEPRLQVNILDRYGKLLKKLNNTNSWDGKYNGKELPSSDYWFVVIRESGKEYRGHFTLKR